MISFSSFAVELIIWEIVLLVNSNNLRKVDYFIFGGFISPPCRFIPVELFLSVSSPASAGTFYQSASVQSFPTAEKKFWKLHNSSVLQIPSYSHLLLPFPLPH